MTSKHTPGPWVVHSLPNAPFNLGHHVTTADGLTVCSVTFQFVKAVDGKVVEVERIANARLIAAAPELLEACQTFAEWLRREEGGFPAETRFNTPEGEAKWREWFDENLRVCALAQEQARAALAKAVGP